METIEIRSNSDLLALLTQLEQSTNRFFDSGETTLTSMMSTTITILNNLEFNERMTDKIISSFKYFKGVLNGNGHTFTVTAPRTGSLFSSIYHSMIRDLTIHNVVGSRGLLLADDIVNSEFRNVKLTGTITVGESIGGFARTTQGVIFADCEVDLNTKSASIDTTLDQINTELIHFGSYVGVDLGGTKFTNCKVSGNVSSEVSVGGFCAIARNCSFEHCVVENFDISGKREVGLFVGRGSRTLHFLDCKVDGVRVTGSSYLGFLVGRTDGEILVDELVLHDSFILPLVASSFVGGVAGTARRIEVSDSHISGNITGNFILAGVCPDVEKAIVQDSIFDMMVTASGYHPMMTHAYPLVRTEYLTASGKEISFTDIDNEQNVKVIELEMEGLVNPFKESIL